MMRRVLFAACLLCGLALAQSQPDKIDATASVQDTYVNPYLLSFATVVDEKGMTLEVATNSKINANIIGLSLTRATLVPCGVQALHLHPNIDEAYLLQSGTVSAALFDPTTNDVNTATLAVGQAFVVPKNWVHVVYNPSCNDTAVVLSSLNSFNPIIYPVGRAALRLPAGPFLPYASPAYLDSLSAAVDGVFAFDPVCLSRCGLGTQGGQLPATVTPAPVPAPILT